MQYNDMLLVKKMLELGKKEPVPERVDFAITKAERMMSRVLRQRTFASTDLAVLLASMDADALVAKDRKERRKQVEKLIGEGNFEAAEDLCDQFPPKDVDMLALRGQCITARRVTDEEKIRQDYESRQTAVGATVAEK